MSKTAVNAGQLFRDARSPTAGQPWVVEKTFIGTDGKEYAQVVCVSDRSLRKTLSTTVLGDRSWFVPV